MFSLTRSRHALTTSNGPFSHTGNHKRKHEILDVATSQQALPLKSEDNKRSHELCIHPVLCGLGRESAIESESLNGRTFNGWCSCTAHNWQLDHWKYSKWGTGPRENCIAENIPVSPSHQQKQAMETTCQTVDDTALQLTHSFSHNNLGKRKS